MKKVFALLAITSLMVACNNSADSTEAKTDTAVAAPVKTDTASATPVTDTTATAKPDSTGAAK